MSRRRISTRTSLAGMRNSDIVPTDKGGFNALQSSSFVLTPSRGLESTNQLSYGESDCTGVTLPKDWPKRIINSSIGLAENNKENSATKSAKSSDLEIDDLPVFNKRNLNRRKRFQANYSTSSSSETENEFEKILSGHIKATQQVDNQNNANDASTPEQSERIQSPKDIELKIKSIPRRRIPLMLDSSDNDSDADIFKKILSGQVKSSQQEPRQNVEVDEHHDSIPSDAQHSSVESDDVVSAIETRSNCRQENALNSHQLTSREEDINLSNASVTLKESIIYHERNSSSNIEEQLDNITDNQEGSNLGASKQKENSPTLDDVSVHTSDQSSRSGFLQNANSNNKRRTSTLTPRNKNVQSDIKETSSISIHESDRDISSGSSSSYFTRRQREQLISKTPDSARQHQKSLSLSGRSSGKSMALIELQLNKSQSKQKQQINVNQSTEQASRQLEIHDAETETESRNRSKRKKTFEKDSMTLDENVMDKSNAMSASKLIRPCYVDLQQILDRSENISRSLRTDLRRSKNDQNHIQTPLKNSTNILSSTKKKQDMILRSTSRESQRLEKSTSKHSLTGKKISFSSVSEDEDVDQSHEAIPSREVSEMKSVAESGKKSLSILSDSRKELSTVSADSVNEEVDQSRRTTPSSEVSKSVAESGKSSSSKLNESKRKLTMVSSDSENEEVDMSRRTTSHEVSQMRSVAESGTKLSESRKKLTVVNSDSKGEKVDRSRRTTTSSEVSQTKSVAESGKSLSTKLSELTKKSVVVNSEDEDEEVDMSRRTTSHEVSQMRSVAESGTKQSESRKKLTVVNSESKGEEADRSRRRTTLHEVSQTKSVAESRKSSSTKLSELRKKSVVVNSEDEDEEVDMSRRTPTSHEVSQSKTVAESGKSSSTKLSESKKKSVVVNSDSKGEKVDRSRRTTTLHEVSQTKSVAESGKSSSTKLSELTKQSAVVNSEDEDEEVDMSRRTPTSHEVSQSKTVAESGKSSSTKLSESRKKSVVVNSDSKGEEADQSRRRTTLHKVSQTSNVSESGNNSSKLSDSSRKLTMVSSDSEDEEINLSRRRQTSIKVPKPKIVAESGNGSLSKLSDSRKQVTLFDSDSENEEVHPIQKTPVSVRVPELKDTLESSVPKSTQSRKKRTSNHEIDEEETNISVPIPAEKLRRDVTSPANDIVSSPVASTSYHQSQPNASKQPAKKKVPLKPVQPTLDGYLTRSKKLPPSELGLKYKSLQDFDKQHNQAELSPELVELRLQLLKDPYIMQETSRINRQKWEADEEQRREKEQARLVKEAQKIKSHQLETKKKATEERKRKRQEQLAKISDDYKVKGKVYKPRLAQPKKWCTTRLYENLQKKMEPIHGIETRLESEKLMLNMVQAVDFITKTAKYDDYKECLGKLKRMLARSGVVVTHDDFWFFAYDYLPYTFRVKAVPMTLPGNVETIPDWDPANDNKPILETA